jgi:hypothetical protein
MHCWPILWTIQYCRKRPWHCWLRLLVVAPPLDYGKGPLLSASLNKLDSFAGQVIPRSRQGCKHFQHLGRPLKSSVIPIIPKIRSNPGTILLASTGMKWSMTGTHSPELAKGNTYHTTNSYSSSYYYLATRVVSS